MVFGKLNKAFRILNQCSIIETIITILNAFNLAKEISDNFKF